MSHQAQAAHDHLRTVAASRAGKLADIDARMDAIKTCTRWLVSRGVFIQRVDMRVGEAGKPVIVVSASPLLHDLFKDECGAGQHWDRSAGRTAHDYKAVRHDCQIEWTEVSQ